MATKNNPGAFDCYANAESDEPMFVLLGRDPAAPEAIFRWAKERLVMGKNKQGDPQIVEALECAAAMVEYREARDARKQRGVVTAPDSKPDESTFQELPQPPKQGINIEIARVWLCGDHDKETLSIRSILDPTCFADEGDPNAGASIWGAALADVARHIATALKDRRDVDEGIALSDIKRFFEAEIASPHDDRTFRLDDAGEEN